jgi:hypothetical protein
MSAFRFIFQTGIFNLQLEISFCRFLVKLVPQNLFYKTTFFQIIIFANNSICTQFVRLLDFLCLNKSSADLVDLWSESAEKARKEITKKGELFCFKQE